MVQVRLALDIESLGWLRALLGTGPEHEDAVERLHALLLRAARFELSRRRRGVAGGGFGDLDDLAVDAADDALVAILRKLHTYRGASSFTTWAFKFVVLEAAVHDARRKLRARLAQDGLALDSPRARDGGGTRSAADRSEAADDCTVGDVGEQGGGRGGAAVVA